MLHGKMLNYSFPYLSVPNAYSSDYSLRIGYREVISDAGILIPFLVTAVAAYFISAVLSALAGMESAGNISYFHFAYPLAIDIIIFVIEGFGVLWQSISVKMKRNRNYFTLESSFWEAKNSIEKYLAIFIIIGIVYFLLSLIPFTEGILAGIWAGYAFFSLMASVLRNEDFFKVTAAGINLLREIYRNEEITGIFFILAILISGIPVISAISIIALVSFGSIVLYVSMMMHGL